MRKYYRTRWPDKEINDIPNGIRYEKPFITKDVSETLVYELVCESDR
jgi:hypothetical protein